MTPILVAAGSAVVVHGVLEAQDESSLECQYGTEEPTEMLPLGCESTVAPDSTSPPPVWPWPDMGQFSSPYHNPYVGQSFQASCFPWPGSNAHIGSWTAAYPQVAFPSPLNLIGDTGIWPYPEVPDTRFNTVPLQVLPEGDYSAPLANHLTLATKEKI